MTREEELDWLYRLRSEIYVYMPKEWLIPMNNALDMAIKALEQEPKTGHWREDIDNNRRWDRVRFYCSKCGDWQIYGKTHYCPNCGAKMQSEAE